MTQTERIAALRAQYRAGEIDYPTYYAQVVEAQGGEGPTEGPDTSDAPTARPRPTGVGIIDPERRSRLAAALAYCRDYTGTWGLPLDIRADRRFGTAHMTLTDRQVEVLLAGRDRDAARAADADFLRELFAAAEYERHVARTAVVATGAGPVVEDGMYRTADGTVYKVQEAKLTHGRLYAKRLDVEDGKGVFVYERGAITRLTPAMRMTLDEAREYGRLYGVCVRCGSPLTDEVSIAAGIGPICAGRF